MVSAGLDTVPGNLIMGLAYLSSEHGQEIQKRAYEEIMKVYPDGDAWERCLVEEKVPYVTAIVREVLRFFTVIPICLPRTSIKDVEYKGAVIPAGTTFYMVCITYFWIFYFENFPLLFVEIQWLSILNKLRLTPSLPERLRCGL